jgi:hypothetical protein
MNIDKTDAYVPVYAKCLHAGQGRANAIAKANTAVFEFGAVLDTLTGTIEQDSAMWLEVYSNSISNGDSNSVGKAVADQAVIDFVAAVSAIYG